MKTKLLILSPILASLFLACSGTIQPQSNETNLPSYPLVLDASFKDVRNDIIEDTAQDTTVDTVADVVVDVIPDVIEEEAAAVCIPTTCASNGLVCGSLINNCGQVEVCPTCLPNTLCAPDQKSCQSFQAVCKTIRLLGGCDELAGPPNNTPGSKCTDYFDAVTVLPAVALKVSCEANGIGKWSDIGCNHILSNGGCEIDVIGNCTKNISWYGVANNVAGIKAVCVATNTNYVSP